MFHDIWTPFQDLGNCWFQLNEKKPDLKSTIKTLCNVWWPVIEDILSSCTGFWNLSAPSSVYLQWTWQLSYEVISNCTLEHETKQNSFCYFMGISINNFWWFFPFTFFCSGLSSYAKSLREQLENCFKERRKKHNQSMSAESSPPKKFKGQKIVRNEKKTNENDRKFKETRKN